MSLCPLNVTESHAAGVAEPIRADVTASLSAVTKQTGLPGMTFALYGPHVRREYSAGLADRESQAKMQPHAVMMGGSTGKVFVALLAYREIERGRLHYTDKVAQFLGANREYNGLPGASEFTIAMLLAQSTGLVDGTTDIAAFKHPGGAWTNERRFRAARRTKLLFPPGTAFSYSDLNYQILAAVIEAIEHKYFGDLVTMEILRPLRMRGTSPATSRFIPGLASGYAGPTSKPQYENLKSPDKTAQSGLLFVSPASEGGGGGFSTTSPDLAKFMYSLFNGTLIGKQELENMISPPAPVQPYQGGQGQGRYGAGIFTYQTALGTAYGHGGIWYGYRTQMLYYPSFCVGAAMQINSQIDGEGNSLQQFRMDNRIFDMVGMLTELVREGLGPDPLAGADQECVDG
jgi:D-alanyl-D-alanine carboxypeptidase